MRKNLKKSKIWHTEYREGKNNKKFNTRSKKKLIGHLIKILVFYLLLLTPRVEDIPMT